MASPSVARWTATRFFAECVEQQCLSHPSRGGVLRYDAHRSHISKSLAVSGWRKGRRCSVWVLA